MTLATDLGVEATFTSNQAVLRLSGRLESTNSVKLADLFDSMLASGCFSIVMDLEGLEYMDAAALRILLYASSCLLAAGGELTIRAPSGTSTVISGITAVEDLLGSELAPFHCANGSRNDDGG